MSDMLDQIAPCIPALRRYARALVGERATADDLVQECLARAIARWHQRRDSGDPRSWLFAILHNLAISQLRQRLRRGWQVSLDELAPASEPARPAVQERGLEHADLVRALEALSEDHRAVLLLVSVEDLSYAQVAEVLSVPIGTVMSRLARARQQLARLMDAPVSAASSRARPVLRRYT